jgi:hypothetical protein
MSTKSVDDFNDFEALELKPPHGFLMAQEKQTAIARIEPLDIEKSYLIVSNGEAFGIAELEQPAQIKAKEFDDEEWLNQHRITPRERRQWWPDSDIFYVYRIKTWHPYEGVKLYEDGRVINEPQLTAKQWQLVSKAKDLPKQIVLAENVVGVTDKSEFVIDLPVKCKQLDSILSAAYQVDVKEVELENEMIPLYSLALIRKPRMRVSKKSPDKIERVVKTEIKQGGESMPFEIRRREDEYCLVKINPDETEETMACHETEEEAEAQLTALRINVEAEEKDFFGNEQSEEQRLDFVRRQFEDRFNPNDNDEIVGREDYIWVNDIFESFVIANEVGRLFRVDYMMLENGIVFADKEQWVEVERGYRPKGFKHLGSFKEAKRGFEGLDHVIQTGKSETVKKAGFIENLRSLSKSIMDFLKSAESEKKESEINISVSDYGVAQKEVNGELWHFTWSTNAFEDREKEIFSTNSLKQYVDQASQKNEKGFFNFWHIRGTDFAAKQWQMVIGRFLVESGPYLDNERGRAAKDFFSKFTAGHPKIAPEGWGCSPEYKYLPEERDTGIYENIWITRTSTLPRMAAANIWTETSQLTRSKNMALSEDQIKAAVEVFKDEEFVKTLIQEGESKTFELEAAGVAHKGETEKPETEPQKINMEELAAEVGKQFSANLEPVAEAMVAMAAELKELKEWKAKQDRAQGIKDKTEVPRYVFEWKRASEQDETVVTGDDGLKGKKPKEAETGENDPWSQMFK